MCPCHQTPVAGQILHQPHWQSEKTCQEYPTHIPPCPPPLHLLPPLPVPLLIQLLSQQMLLPQKEPITELPTNPTVLDNLQVLLTPTQSHPAGPILDSTIPLNSKLRHRDYPQYLYVHPTTLASPIPTYSFYPYPPHSTQPILPYPTTPVPAHGPFWDTYNTNYSNAPKTSLGHPIPTPLAMELIYNTTTPPSLPPLSPTHPPENDLIFHPRNRDHLTFTHKGWRPTAGSLQHSLQQFLDTNASPLIIKTLKYGHFPQWLAHPEPLYFPNHASVLQHPDIMDTESDTLRRTGALQHYDPTSLGPPTTILPMSLKNEGDKFRLLIDPRYPNLTTQNYSTSYETLTSFTSLLPPDILLTKTDMTSGFHQIPLHPAMRPYVVVQWRNTLYFFTCAFWRNPNPTGLPSHHQTCHPHHEDHPPHPTPQLPQHPIPLTDPQLCR